MLKRCLCFFVTVILLSLTVFIPASAYEPTGFDITAKNVLFASLDTGEILYEKDINKKVYPASITKIMTVLVILESKKYNPDGKVVMTKEVLDAMLGTGSSVSGLKEGEEISQLDLVYLVLMASFGDCAYLAADYYGGGTENFVKLMNDKAKKLGLKNTRYENPVGLHNVNNYTTAKDTFVLASYALKNSTFKKVCETARYSMPPTNLSPGRTISTTNFLQDSTTNYYYTYAKGVKTGYTDEAGRCLVSTASYNGYNYICILFGCPVDKAKRHEFVDSKNLYRWAFNNFEFKKVADDKNPICEIEVNLSLKYDFIPLYFGDGFRTVMPKKADASTITIEPHLKSKSVDAPIKKGDILGYADIIYAEETIGKVDLVAKENVDRSFILYAANGVKKFLISKYMIAFYVVVIIGVAIFFIGVYKLNKGRNRRKIKYIPYKSDDHTKRR